MNGNKAFEIKNMSYLRSLFNKNSDKKYLIGFSNYINNLSSTTIYQYTDYVVNFTNFANKEIDDLNLDDYLAYLSSIKDKTSSYQIAVYSALKKFSKYLAASNRNTSDPMRYVNRPRFVESQETIRKREIGYLETDEITTYINTIKNSTQRYNNFKERDMLIILMLLNTGMRCSALWKLNIDNIDFENSKLVVTDKGSKVIMYDISDELMEYIKIWLCKRDIILNGHEEDALFISRFKNRLDSSCIRQLVKKYSTEIKGKNITPHKLRATFGTQVYKSTNDIYLTQMAMNHSSPNVTEKYIRGQSDKSKKVAADIMSKLTFGD